MNPDRAAGLEAIDRRLERLDHVPERPDVMLNFDISGGRSSSQPFLLKRADH